MFKISGSCRRSEAISTPWQGGLALLAALLMAEGGLANSGATGVARALANDQQPIHLAQNASQEPPPPPVPPEPKPPALEEQLPIQAPSPGSGLVTFRLRNADMVEFIRAVAAEIKLNYVLDPTVQGTVTISTEGDLHREDLFPLLQAVLKINGAVAVQTGNFYRIVPLAKAAKNPLEIFPTASGKTLPADERLIMQIMPLHYASAAELSKVLSPFLSESGSLVVHESGNILILVDTSLNVQSLVDLVAQFDNLELARQRVRLFPVQNNVASSLVPELEAIFAAYGLSEKKPSLRFVPIDRINAILVVANDAGVYDEVQAWLTQLDKPAAPSGVQTFIYRVQNSEADYLAKLLASIQGGGRPNEGTAPPTTTPGDSAASEPSGGVRIIPDPVNNSLIIQASPHQYGQIVATLQEIDVIPRQVLIEARVYEVTLTGDLLFGVSYFLQQRSDAVKQPLASFSVLQALQASAGLLIGNTRELMFFLNARDNRSRVRVVSAPTVLATDNSQAKIQVGSEIPILTSQAVTPGAQVGGTNVFTNTVQNRDTGIILTVTPRITANGLVSLQITQEISSAIPPPSDAIQSPSFLKRMVTTRAVVQDGETIALGGLIQDSVTTRRNRIPLLGDIPGLGLLFGTTSRNSEKTELIVLLTPRIIPDVPTAQTATRELKNKLRDLRRSFKRDTILNPPTE